MLTRIGTCNNCGACCYVYSLILKRFHLCEYYSVTKPEGHCLIHKNRPNDCKMFPRSPDDLKQGCSYQFVDDQGRVVSAWMNPKTKLTPLKM